MRSIFPNKTKIIILFCLLVLSNNLSAASKREKNIDKRSSQKIMLALLLDTSNSMDGLIEQAKSQLWTIVNELSTAKCDDGSHPEVKIALFEYGNDGLPASEGYMRMVVNLTDDLDEISEKLFGLRTNGGEEYCGQVIKKSIYQLNWSDREADLKMIFIAGNEPFTQGSVSYHTACSLAKDKDIVVNTIFCGSYAEGVNTFWKKGAELTGGTYMNIAQDRKTVFVSTPYDQRIADLNESLNSTYIYYGSRGHEKKESQIRQDANAAKYGQANKVKRTVSKSSHVYINSSWDLVDATNDDDTILDSLSIRDLPDIMQSMTQKERKTYINNQSQRRKAISKEIQMLNGKRKQYLAEHQPEKQNEMLDKAMVKSIKTIAKNKNLIFE